MRLRKAVRREGIKVHLKDLQDIAVANDGTGPRESRALTRRGLCRRTCSRRRLRRTRQEFDFDAFIVNAPAELEQTAPTPDDLHRGHGLHLIMDYSGSGDPTANVTGVDLVLPPGPNPSSSNSGCEAKTSRASRRATSR